MIKIVREIKKFYYIIKEVNQLSLERLLQCRLNLYCIVASVLKLWIKWSRSSPPPSKSSIAFVQLRPIWDTPRIQMSEILIARTFKVACRRTNYQRYHHTPLTHWHVGVVAVLVLLLCSYWLEWINVFHQYDILVF